MNLATVRPATTSAAHATVGERGEFAPTSIPNGLVPGKAAITPSDRQPANPDE